METSTARTAVLVDSHPLWLDALNSLVERLSLRVVGQATRQHDAEALLAEHKPDVLVTENATAGLNSGPPELSLLACARSENPNVKCIVLSGADDARERELAFAAGAAVFCVKRAERDDLVSAIRQTFDPSVYFPQKPTSAGVVEGTATADDAQFAELTKREIEILRLTVEGYSHSQLAKMLWVTEQTVKFHLSNIYRKLDVGNRTEASRWAQLHGVVAMAPLDVGPEQVGSGEPCGVR